jgi:hypothetical protein
MENMRSFGPIAPSKRTRSEGQREREHCRRWEDEQAMMIARGGESIEKPFRPSLLSRLSSSYLLRQLGDGLGVDGLLLVVGGHGASSRLAFFDWMPWEKKTRKNEKRHRQPLLFFFFNSPLSLPPLQPFAPAARISPLSSFLFEYI